MPNIYLKVTIEKIRGSQNSDFLSSTLSDPDGVMNHPPSYKKCHNFWKTNDVDLKFYDFS